MSEGEVKYEDVLVDIEGLYIARLDIFSLSMYCITSNEQLRGTITLINDDVVKEMAIEDFKIIDALRLSFTPTNRIGIIVNLEHDGKAFWGSFSKNIRNIKEGSEEEKLFKKLIEIKSQKVKANRIREEEERKKEESNLKVLKLKSERKNSEIGSISTPSIPRTMEEELMSDISTYSGLVEEAEQKRKDAKSKTEIVLANSELQEAKKELEKKQNTLAILKKTPESKALEKAKEKPSLNSSTSNLAASEAPSLNSSTSKSASLNQPKSSNILEGFLMSELKNKTISDESKQEFIKFFINKNEVPEVPELFKTVGNKIDFSVNYDFSNSFFSKNQNKYGDILVKDLGKKNNMYLIKALRFGSHLHLSIIPNTNVLHFTCELYKDSNPRRHTLFTVVKAGEIKGDPIIQLIYKNGEEYTELTVERLLEIVNPVSNVGLNSAAASSSATIDPSLEADTRLLFRCLIDLTIEAFKQGIIKEDSKQVAFTQKFGGYYEKYIKYKTKYLQLKKLLQ